MFVGALFRDSSSRILKHYRGLVDEVEREAEDLARKQIEEEEARQEYLENVSDFIDVLCYTGLAFLVDTENLSSCFKITLCILFLQA